MARGGLGRVALLGTGLIGGSFAAALKRHGLASHIVAYSAGDAHAALALGLAADAALFRNRTVILSPLDESEPSKAARLESVWQRLGATVVRLSPQEHDRIYALVSHWPHALGFALGAAVAGNGVADDLVGPGLLDLTRTAASSPALWADILLQNGGPALDAADLVAEELAHIRAAIRDGDRESLIALFSRAAAWRGRFG